MRPKSAKRIFFKYFFSQTQPGHHQVFQKTAGQSITLHWIRRITVGHLTQTRLLIGRAVTIPELLQMTMILIWIRKYFNKSPLSELNLKIRLEYTPTQFVVCTPTQRTLTVRPRFNMKHTLTNWTLSSAASLDQSNAWPLSKCVIYTF